MAGYINEAEWSDVEPIPQDLGGPNPLAAIIYNDEYSEAMSYLRAVMAKNESSKRVLSLTENIISMNPAHYTVWLYRAKVLFELGCDLKEEIEWLNPIALRHLKNYQIWHHRQTLIDRIGSPEGEIDFLTTMFKKDTKNYHVWSYRQWLVRRFDLWDQGELEALDVLLRDDVRNNSAWNHRWFVVFARDGTSAFENKDIIKREIEYAKAAIYMAPQNQSPWNYLKGLQQKSKFPLTDLKEFVTEFASLDKPDDVHSSHALDLMAEIYVEENKKQEAAKALDLLAEKYDPIRVNYWNFRKSSLGLTTTAA